LSFDEVNRTDAQSALTFLVNGAVQFDEPGVLMTFEENGEDNPQLAQGDQILALPTLVRRLPEPIKKIIGDLSNRERVLVGLDLRARRD
jgi:hypothetical protein